MPSFDDRKKQTAGNSPSMGSMGNQDPPPPPNNNVDLSKSSFPSDQSHRENAQGRIKDEAARDFANKQQSQSQTSSLQSQTQSSGSQSSSTQSSGSQSSTGQTHSR